MANNMCIDCKDCKALFRTHDFEGPFERWGQGDKVRLINNPAVWGSSTPRVRLLGFSKGNTQNKQLAKAVKAATGFEAVPFKGMRHRLQWLLEALRLMPNTRKIDEIFNTDEPDFQSASLVRCSISAKGPNDQYSYKLSDILEAAKNDDRVMQIVRRCAERHLADSRPGQVLLLLGISDEQIDFTKAVLAKIFPSLKSVNRCAYRTESFSFVHVAHPSGNQTDPQYLRWVRGETADRKVEFAKAEVAFRMGRS